MVTTREDLISRIHARIGDSTSDDDIALLEDASDTLDDFVERTRDATNWRERYEENDRSWRQRYIDRFNSDVETGDGIEPESGETELEYEAPKTYDELFIVK